LHSGDHDHVAPLEELLATREALRHNPRAEVTIYPGIGHNFTTPGRDTYDEAVANAAMTNALQLLAPLRGTLP
jgi:dienelactone hydrolase